MNRASTLSAMLIRLSKSTLALVAVTLIAACSNSDGSTVPGGSSNNNGNGNNGTGGNSLGIGTGNGAGSTGV
ncbi:MAG TPA: hypothetical protein VK745_16370, partial [Polyangiaceae bacterium]|nr:hypothetical protein [Polyangiaceae bacterium]